LTLTACYPTLPKESMSLKEPYRVNEEELRKRRSFLGVNERDSENVRALRKVFAQYARTFAERFYQHLLSHSETASLLRDPAMLERLKVLQANYFAELLEGIFDEAYFEGRLRVGLAHQRIGLEPVWYLGAYNQYIQLTFPLFAQAYGNNFDQALPKLLSLVKVIFLDIGLALHTYFAKATEDLRHRNEELEQALNLYWRAHRREQQLHKLISHEIRGGLAAMITSLEDLLDVAKPKMDQAAQEQLEAVTRRGWSISRLLGEMLIEADSGKGPGYVETAPIFEHLVARFGMYAEGRPIQLHLPEHPPRVWADGAQLREVFANLVSNAVRYMDRDNGQVEISCRSEGDFYAFCVADDGPGIPSAIRDRIFEPFVRGPATEARPGGTGLGLYFVRSIIEQAGGRAWLESPPGEGSRFWFTVRRSPPSSESELKAQPEAS
jgi:signal transduction histidine kinase